MNRNEIERAWPAAEPPPGFPQGVIERLQRDPARSEPARRRTSWLAWLGAPRVRWLALPALALALGGLFLLSPTPPAQRGDVIAAEPRAVAIGERAIAELSSGAHVRWSGEEVQQDSGEVTYRVAPGERFRVQTPYGRVVVLGTVFRVVVADRKRTEGEEPMKKRWAVAGASATLGALLLVGVQRGSVQLSAGEHELVVGAGQSGSVGSDGVPRLSTPEPNPPADARGSTAEDSERSRARRVADAVRRHAARRRAAARAAHPASDEPGSAPTADEPAAPPTVFGPSPMASPPPSTPEEARRRDYIRRTMREQYFPVARACYDELLARQPTAGGKLTLEFAIVGDADAGVVDRVALRDDETTIDDAEFRLCMSESMYTAVFEPPPPGAEESTVVYPIVLAPE